METVWNQVASLLPTSQHQTTVVGIVVAVIIGLLICFFGYRFMKVWIAIAGFLIGLVLGFLIPKACGANMTLCIIIALVAAIALGIVGFAIYKVGIFIFAGVSAYTAAANLIGQHIADPNVWWAVVIAVLVGVAIGFLAMRFVRPVIVITTAISGALMISRNILPAMKVESIVVIYIVTAVIAILGIVWQFASTKHMKK